MAKHKPFKTAWFYEECWSDNIYLVWPVTTGQLQVYLKRKFNIAEDIDGDWAGRCLELVGEKRGCYGHVIALAEWNRNNVRSLSALAHECLHCTDQILRYRGLPLTESSVEAYTYLHDSLFRRCLEKLK